MKTFKKVLASALAAAMVVTAFPVTNAEAATKAKLSATKATIYVGQSKTIKVTLPAGAKISSVKTSKKTVATVKKSGKKVVVKAVKAGKATVTVKVTPKKGSAKKLTAKITVKTPSVKYTDSVKEVSVGKTAKLAAKATPSTTVKYYSADKSIATVGLTSGKVTGKSAGTVKIAAVIKTGTKTTKVYKTITVIDADKNEITTSLATNIEGQDHAVLVTDNATVKVKVVKNGKPAANKQVVLTAVQTTSNANADYAVLSSNYATTDANGIASFVIGNKKSVTSVTDTDAVAEVKYTASVADNSVNPVSDVEAFAAVSYGNVQYLNGTDATKYAATVPGTNYKAANPSGTGKSTTKSVNGNANVDFVASQQVSSKGTTDHEVTFSAVPSLVIPSGTTSADITKTFTQPINKKSGKYGTYANVSKIVEVKTDVSKLDYATLYVKNIQISKYSEMVISAYPTQKDAENKTNVIANSTQSLAGEKEQTPFGYQIPKNGSVKYIRVEIISKGQVNVNKNNGFELDKIEGMYKTTTSGNVTKVIGGVTVAWAADQNITYSEDKTLTSTQAKTLGIDDTNKTGYKYIYQVPTFPQAGNAVIREYDAKGTLKAYYAVPAVNMLDSTGKVVNENDIFTNSAKTTLVSDKAFLITEEEAKNIVGTVTQSGDVVKVNSETVGTTKLVGTVKIAGANDANVAVENGKVYTSVAWAPIPKSGTTASDKKEGAFVAIKGQTVKVNAQITDKNGNPVAQSGVNVKFSYGKTEITGVGTLGATKVKATYVPSQTDVHGKCELTLQASDVATLEDLSASVTGNYNVVLNITDKTVDLADIYWVDAYLAYTPSAIDYADETGLTNEYTSKSAKIPTSKPNAGETWEYGVLVKSTALSDGLLNGATATISGLKTKYTVSGMTDVTVTSTTDGTAATVASNKGGLTKLKAALDTSALNDNAVVTVTKAGKTLDATFAGTGSVNIFDTLTIPVQWQSVGVTATWVNPYGTKSADDRTVYLKVIDNKGNAIQGKKVTFEFDNATHDENTNGDGVASYKVTKSTSNPSTIVTATVDGLTETFSTTINWTNATENLQPVQAVYEQGTPDKITLTFNKDIDAASVNAKEFTVTTGAADTLAKYTVANAAVNGNKVVLTLSGNNVLAGKSAEFTVTVGTANVNSVKYNLLAEDGSALSSSDKAITFASDSDDELTLSEATSKKITVTVPATTAERYAYAVDENGKVVKITVANASTTGESGELTAGGYYIVYYGNVVKDITLAK